MSVRTSSTMPSFMRRSSRSSMRFFSVSRSHDTPSFSARYFASRDGSFVSPLSSFSSARITRLRLLRSISTPGAAETSISYSSGVVFVSSSSR